MTQPATENRPKMLTIPQLEATQILPGRAIRRLVADGKIPTVKIGNRHYINYTVLVEQLSSGIGEVWK